MFQSNTSEHDAITRKEMCVIEKCPDGSLQTAFYPIDYDYQILEQLYSLSRTMLKWENRLRTKLVSAIKEKCVGSYGNQDLDLEAFVCNYRDTVLEICELTKSKDEISNLFPTSTHDHWRYPTSVYCLSKYAAFIKGFNISRKTIEACHSQMDESVFRGLEKTYSLALNMRSCLLPALEKYEKGFFAYIERLKQTYPQVLEKKKYCQDFSGYYGNADLDYDMTPGNQCIVEKIEEYYWACVMEHLYGVYEHMDNVLAYSHRRRGFYDYTIVIEPKCDLHLFQETNFGFGSVKYFRTTLRYKGVSAINAPFLIFFNGVGKVAFSNYTFNYEVEEASFESCFNEAVRIHSEYNEIGEADFVDKYFRKSLADLSDLLLIVAKTNTFLQITTLERFEALSSSASNELIPNEGFARIDLKLSTAEKDAVKDLVGMILPITETPTAKEFEINSELRRRVDQLISPYTPGSLQLMVKKDLIRSLMILTITPSLETDFDVGSLVEKLIEPDEGIFVETLEGYKLINMRIEKAMSVIRPIARLRDIAALTKFDSIIDSIASTCSLIGEQARQYISKEIAPELDQMIPKRNLLLAQLDGAEKDMEATRHRGDDTGWIARQIRELRTRLQDLNGEISTLSTQKESLERYIQKAKAINNKR